MLAVVVDPIDAFVRPPPRTRTTTPTTSHLVPLEAAASASNLRRIDDWTLTSDGRIQGFLKDGSGDQVVTSQLADPEVAANGVIVTTQSGSRYKLLKQGTTRISAPPAAAPAAGTAANRNDPRSILSGYLRQKQQQAAPVEEEVVAVSKKTSGNKLVSDLQPLSFPNIQYIYDDVLIASHPSPLLIAVFLSFDYDDDDDDDETLPNSRLRRLRCWVPVWQWRWVRRLVVVYWVMVLVTVSHSKALQGLEERLSRKSVLLVTVVVDWV